MANNKIITTELDFDRIKANLKTYLQGQSQFSDYDFEGSSLSILLDVLAYNTHYNALYTNLAINEAFLDSASKRASVVSKAKELGYTPRTATCSTALVDVVVEGVPAGAFTIPKYTAFAATVDGVNYTFHTTDTYTGYPADNVVSFTKVQLKEGSVLGYTFNVDQATSFLIPNPYIDADTLIVDVQDNPQSVTSRTFVRADTIVDLDGSSEVYFLAERDGGFYELEFGDGNIGKALVPGNVVTITYMVPSQAGPNGARAFTYQGSLSDSTTVYVTPILPAYGGSGPESIESIKWNAPRQLATQNRCVTLEDYKTVIRSKYPYIDSISVWGGEDNVPPSYGDVFISIKPAGGLILSQPEKEYILSDVIGTRRIVTVHPKFVDPSYLNVMLDVTFYYDADKTNQSASTIAEQVRQTISQYNTNYLNKFDGILRYSQLQRMIDNSNTAITNSIVTLKLQRPFDIIYNEDQSYVLDVGNPIYNSGAIEHSVLSGAFTALNVSQTVYIEDVPVEGRPIGGLRMFYYSGGTRVPVKDVGTIDYEKGIINITGVVVTGTEGDYPALIIKPQSNDVVSVRNQIVTIPDTLVTVNAVANVAGQYKFTSSRN